MIFNEYPLTVGVALHCRRQSVIGAFWRETGSHSQGKVERNVKTTGRWRAVFHRQRVAPVEWERTENGANERSTDGRACCCVFAINHLASDRWGHFFPIIHMYQCTGGSCRKKLKTNTS